MESIQTDSKPHPQFDWIGLAALLVGIDIPLRLLANLRLSGFLPIFLILVSLPVLVVYVRRYDLKNSFIALLLICTLHPIRFIFHWWLNPVLYGVVTVLCLLFLLRGVWRYNLKTGVTALLLICALLSGFQTLISASEVDHCYIEDIRWTRYFYCESSAQGYQQIESLPVGMRGYCYYCPWYEGVGRW